MTAATITRIAVNDNYLPTAAEEIRAIEAEQAEPETVEAVTAAPADVEEVEPLDCTPERFAAILDYYARKDEPTQNAEGVRVGDLFSCSWGYEQTNVDYYQVIALKGKHTAVIREIRAEHFNRYRMGGDCRPLRNEFDPRAEEYTVRTQIVDWRKEVCIKAPGLAGHYLRQTNDFAHDDYSSYA